MMGDEVLGPLGDPGEVADAELAALAERKSQHQPGGIAKRAEPLCKHACLELRRPHGPDSLGFPQVEAKQIATILPHTYILTSVEPLITVTE